MNLQEHEGVFRMRKPGTDRHAESAAYYALHKNKQVTYRKNWEDLEREKIEEAKTQCFVCGEKRKYLLDFHHVDPAQKEFEISAGLRNHGIDATLKEMDKCIVLCKNCHKEVHHRAGLRHDTMDALALMFVETMVIQ